MEIVEVDAYLDVPEVLRPLVETRLQTVRFYDLSEYSLSVEEKLFLVKEILGDTQRLPATFIRKDSGVGKCTAKGIAERYNINPRTVQKWVESYDNGNIFKDGSGRPALLDDIGKEAIRSEIISSCKARKPIKTEKLPELITKCMIATQERQGKRNIQTTASPSYFRKIEKEVKIKKRKAQALNHGRTEAENDPRLCYLVACIFEAFSGHLPAEYKWNADATTLITHDDGEGETVCFLPSNEEEIQQYERKLDSSEITNSMALLVKWVQFCNAAGEMGPLTLVFSMPGIPEGKFFAQKVKGLAKSVDIDAEGWVYFCNTRAGNAAMWQHWYINVVTYTMGKARDVYKLFNEKGDPLSMLFSTDGEAVIMNEAFTQQVHDAFQEGRIDFIKNGPSLTHLYQACDRSPIFRDYRTGMREVTKKSIVQRNEKLRYGLSEVRKLLHTEFTEIVNNAHYWEKIYCACEKTVFVMRGKWVTSEKIVTGFIETGQHVLGVNFADPEQCTVDYNKIMAICPATDLSEADREVMRSQRHLVHAEYRRNGSVSDDFLTSIGIVNNEHCKNRDNFIYYRQSCLLISHDYTLDRYRERMADKEQRKIASAQASDPTYREQQRLIKEAQKVVQAAAKKNQKEAEKAAAREAEDIRKSHLTPAQLRAEREARKLANAEKKANQLAKNLEALHNANKILSNIA